MALHASSRDQVTCLRRWQYDGTRKVLGNCTYGVCTLRRTTSKGNARHFLHPWREARAIRRGQGVTSPQFRACFTRNLTWYDEGIQPLLPRALCGGFTSTNYLHAGLRLRHGSCAGPRPLPFCSGLRLSTFLCPCHGRPRPPPPGRFASGLRPSSRRRRGRRSTRGPSSSASAAHRSCFLPACFYGLCIGRC